MDTQPPKTCNRLTVVVIQEQDVAVAMQSLAKLGVYVTHLSSEGGFLANRSATLLVGYQAGQDQALVDALSRDCRTRVEYITIPVEGAAMHLAAPTPITVGGATLFVLDVERFEEIS